MPQRGTSAEGMNPPPGPLADQDSTVATARRPLRVLMVEDNPDDVALILRLIRRGGYEPHWRQVQTAVELENALAVEPWDIVLSDYTMPHFDGLSALATLRSRSGVLPFIVISGSIGEETAVAAMRAGASDYLMKTNLTRLLPAIEREVGETAARRQNTRTENALHDLQDQFQVIFHEYLDVMMILDAHNGDILHVNRAMHGVMGYDENRLPGQPFAILWPADRQATPAGLLERVRREGSVFHSGEFSRVDGTLCPMDMLANRVTWGRGEAIIVTLRDVSERLRAERRLGAEKEQLAVTLRSIGEGVITTDVDGRILLLNVAAARLTGWSQAQALGRPICDVLDLLQGSGEVPCEEQMDVVLCSGRTLEISRNLYLRSLDGLQRSLALTSAPILDHSGRPNGVVVTFRDITNEQKLEDELQKASRLESVSLLAGGIAHDFNNILTAIVGHLSLARAHAAPAEAVIDKVERACQYATDLTRQLLTFAKGSVTNRKRENLAGIVRESAEFALHGSNLRGEFSFADDLHPVEVNRTQIHRVVNNLAINAVQACPAGGRLFVTASNVEVTREEPVGGLATGDYVRVSVRDTGCGISPEHIGRIFDPYFTTKSAGSGLGLSTSYSILRNHEGLLQAESTLGEGSTFSMYLPVGGAALESSPALVDINNEPRASKGRVLFMDDEEVLQEMVAAMLEYLGFEPVTASDGQEAIRLFLKSRDEGRPISAVIVDLTVPGGMGGYETFQRLREIDPKVRVMVSSGYSNDPLMADFEQYGFIGSIAKPFHMEQLGKAVQRAIAR